MCKSPLKVAVLLSNESSTIPAWAKTLIDMIRSTSYSSIEVLVLAKKNRHKHDLSNANNVINKFEEITTGFVVHALEALAKRAPVKNSYCEAKDFSYLLDLIPVEKVELQCSENSSELTEEALERIKSYSIDVLINLDTVDLRGAAVDTFPLGVWHYKFTEMITNAYGTPGLRETLENWPTIGASLVKAGSIMSEDKFITTSYSCPDTMWPHISNNRNYWKSVAFVPRALKKIQHYGTEFFFDEIDNNTPPFINSERIKEKLSHVEFLLFISKKIIKKVYQKLQNKRFFEQWVLLYNIDPKTSHQLSEYQYIFPPKDRFWADPFVIHKDNQYYIFIEELIYEEDKGFLSVITMDEKGMYSEPEVILEKPYHLSYPFIFEHEGEYMMIPESAQNKTIELYRCTDFPKKWEPVMNLMENITAVDTTLLYKDEVWWMFTNMREIDGASNHEELFLFYADTLQTTEWIPHPKNPIVSDVKNARPGGKVFESNGKLFRPAQNCSHTYGYGLRFNEITALDKENYQEQTVTKVHPFWDEHVTATHTRNKAGNLIVMDAIYRRKRK